MLQRLKTTVTAAAISAMVVGGLGVADMLFSAEPAFAKGNNNGNGGGNSNGNSGNRGNGNGNSSNNERGNNGNGSTASALGALNAAHANENAFRNASENSRVGLIRTYMEAMNASDEAQLTYDDAVTLLENFETFEPQFETYEDFLAAFEADPTDLGDEGDYWSALNALTDTETTLAELKLAADDALKTAANKEITEEVIVDLWELLDGLELDEEPEDETAD